MPWDKLINQSQEVTQPPPPVVQSTAPLNPVPTSFNTPEDSYLNGRLDRGSQPDRDNYSTQGDS